MKTFYFNKTKHTFDLQMDFGAIEKNPNLSFENVVHTTNFFEIFIFREISGTVVIDTEKIDLVNNTFLFLSPYQKRNWQLNNNSVKGYFLVFEKDFFSEFFSDDLFLYRLQFFYNKNVKPYFIPNKRLFSFENDIFEEIDYEFKHFKSDSIHLLRSILYYVIIKLNREFCSYHGLESETRLNNNAYLFKKHLEEHIFTQHNIKFYTDLLQISRITLNKLVKAQFGVPVTQMIKERLLSEVKSELLYTTKTISEIAFHLNFSESNNLNRFFKSRTQLTPKQFRLAYQNDSFLS